MPTRSRGKLLPRAIVGLVSATTAVGALAADFLVPASARQHMRNPRWPGHAKFHDAQYIVMSGLLGGLGLRLVTRPDDVDRNLLAAATLVSVPWLGMYGAALFPGTALVDEEFVDPSRGRVLGVEGNLAVATSCLALLAVGIGLARRPVR